MNNGTVFVAIVAILAWAAIRIARYRAGFGDMPRRRHTLEQTAPPQPDPKLLRELEDLRERIAVLERIATSDRQTKAIAAEIESLRDS